MEPTINLSELKVWTKVKIGVFKNVEEIIKKFEERIYWVHRPETEIRRDCIDSLTGEPIFRAGCIHGDPDEVEYAQKVGFDGRIEGMFRNSASTLSPVEKEISLGKISVAKLGFQEKPHIEKVIEAIQELKLELFPLEAAASLCLTPGCCWPYYDELFKGYGWFYPATKAIQPFDPSWGSLYFDMIYNDVTKCINLHDYGDEQWDTETRSLNDQIIFKFPDSWQF